MEQVIIFAIAALCGAIVGFVTGMKIGLEMKREAASTNPDNISEPGPDMSWEAMEHYAGRNHLKASWHGDKLAGDMVDISKTETT